MSAKKVPTTATPADLAVDVITDDAGTKWVQILLPVGDGPVNGFGELAHKPYSRVREHILRREEGLALWRLRDGIEASSGKLQRKEEVVSVILRLVWDALARAKA